MTFGTTAGRSMACRAAKGQGSVKQRFVYYQVNFNGPLMVEQDRCLPNP